MHAGGDGVAVGKNTAETIGIGGGGGCSSIIFWSGRVCT